MMNEMHDLIESYFSWLKDKTILRQMDDWVGITTPHLDRHNDHIQIYARMDNGKIIISDDGYTITDLEQSGCRLDSPKRQKLLNIALNGFGVKLIGEELQVHATPDDFPRRKHNLLQAMLAINDMFYLATPYVASIFYEDVVDWLKLSGIRFVPNVKFTGKSGFDYLFNFAIPGFQENPERVLQLINNPSKESATKFFTAWFDTRENRPQDSKAYALLNDTDRPVPTAVREALSSYDIMPVVWSERESVRAELAA